MVPTESILRVNIRGKELHMDSEKFSFHVSGIEFEKKLCVRLKMESLFFLEESYNLGEYIIIAAAEPK